MITQDPGRSVVKRVLFGRPLASEAAAHQLLPKWLALPVFSSDPLSSNAYATEEIMLVLVAAGAMALRHVLPIAFVIAAVLTIVVISYRQTVRAYPSGGGAYIVSKENHGELPGLIAAAALLIDYVLTVSVSIVAGVAAITSAAEGLNDYRVEMSLGFVVLITLMNLRGVRESGVFFAIPTYGFVLCVYVMIAAGFVQCFGGCPEAETAHLPLEATHGLTLFLVLRAFSSGSTALTGVEAISNGVPAFRKPQSHNAASTLAMMGVMSITMFIGISFLATRFHVRPLHERTVISQVAETAFGRGLMFFIIQAMTAAILILAANTAYQDFPRLSSILARDRYMPRQFMNRGDRLVFSNGVIVLAIVASLLIVIFDADVTRLIQLYVVGVFTSFTLSQSGMVRHWLKVKGPNWRRSAVINGIGAVATGIVLVVITATKFMHGAYIVVIASPLLVWMFRGINRHYRSVAQQLRRPVDQAAAPARTRALVLIPAVDEAAMRALGYARALRPVEIRALYVGDRDREAEARAAWASKGIRISLDMPAGDELVDGVRSYMRGMERVGDEFVTVVLPERVRSSGLVHFLRGRKELMLKAAMLFEPQVVVTDVPTREAGANPQDVRGPIAPTRNVALVLVSAVHNATLRAIAYAEAIQASEIRAVTFNVDEGETRKILADWASAGTDVPLEAVDSPYREVTRPLLKLVRQIRSSSRDTVVTIILPEFVVSKWYHQFLHNQTALSIKAALLFEPGVVMTSVPYHLR
ncbi:MAG: APC family permease [Actinomycetota bacterium]